MEYQLIPMEEKHLLTLAALERICFSDPWSENAFRAELDNPGARFTVAQDGAGTVLGYLGLHYVLDEGYIANIAVDPLFRRQGDRGQRCWMTRRILPVRRALPFNAGGAPKQSGRTGAVPQARVLPCRSAEKLLPGPCGGRYFNDTEADRGGKPEMKLLAIESSCDETAAAVVENGRRVLSSVINSQVEEHRQYGGVIPEIASRRHTENIIAVTQKALDDASVCLEGIDGIAVTYAPGLIGAVLVGVNFAKGLAMATKKPLIPVHHIRGHIAANYLAHPELEPPFLCLVVSGGHSHLIEVLDYTKFHIVGAPGTMRGRGF